MENPILFTHRVRLILIVCKCCVVLSLSVNCQNAHVSVTEMQSQTNIQFYLDIFSVPWTADITTVSKNQMQCIPHSSYCLLISTLFSNMSPIHTYGAVHMRCTQNYLNWGTFQLLLMYILLVVIIFLGYYAINLITFLLTGNPKSY